jgi:hypothetical protein
MIHAPVEVVTLAITAALIAGCPSSRGTTVPSGADLGRDAMTAAAAGSSAPLAVSPGGADASVAANGSDAGKRADPAPSQAPQVTDTDAVVIENSGSTNALPYRIVVSRSGQASYECGDDKATVSLPGDMVSRLFADVGSARPLSAMAGRHCPKSVSFGTRTFLQVGDDRSPDISCPGNDSSHVLMADVGAIAQELHVGFRRRHRGRTP